MLWKLFNLNHVFDDGVNDDCVCKWWSANNNDNGINLDHKDDDDHNDDNSEAATEKILYSISGFVRATLFRKAVEL